jgi:hypothetical protein
MPAFDNFPEEGKIIGRLLAGYGELELMLCGCVAEARGDFNSTFKAMFRPRGETYRIDIADALGRDLYEASNLGQHFSEAIGDTRFCRKVRNQYAHCYWADDFGRCLGLVELEETARQNAQVFHNELLGLARDIDVPTLKAQEAFFVRTNECFSYLLHEYQVRAGTRTTNPFALPKKELRPPLYKP